MNLKMLMMQQIKQMFFKEIFGSVVINIRTQEQLVVLYGNTIRYSPTFIEK